MFQVLATTQAKINTIELSPSLGGRGVAGVPCLVLVEVDVAAAAPKLVGVVGVRENET